MRTALNLAVIAFVLIAAGGWVANIVKALSMLDGGITAMLVARLVGIFAFPLGSVLGFM